MTDKYSDIIHLPYQKSKKRPPMLNSHRAAQFAPFAALTGHDMAVREVARLTVDKLELDESSITRLNEKIQRLKEHLLNQPRVTITYFQHDEKKSGGVYVTTDGYVKKIDDYHNTLVMSQGTLISFSDIFDIECHELFCHDESF
ncbi:YolD-like family protein [Turicibacter sanguinis]|jgi:yolD-like protein|uniref:Uncharacterized protein n=2 Tax=Turicibacteraceae TaxID=2810281 RepID=A0A6I3NHT2_9FIRM|nr:YolD-like family protein [Turicibacter sanguinis]EGC92669.1 YolD-like protein [Turicibacter sp. HGF1]MTK70848.1 hypothetical protein [Turicibacter sanguinis]MTK81942.1 hypothetical protein [Turicibacter sanguinis]MTK84224.1 hypothetical protein [Turicibacter sanguinis]MTK86648.1 hypothetical protein [Turicibacter sanguinis]